MVAYGLIVDLEGVKNFQLHFSSLHNLILDVNWSGRGHTVDEWGPLFSSEATG